MRELKLTRLLRLAMVPAFAVGVSVSSLAQTTAPAASTAPGTAAAAQAKPDNTQYRGVRASKMISKDVRNPEGKNLGQIRDLVIDMSTGDVRYAMLEFDPGIFKGERLFAVPTKELRMAADNDQLIYDMTHAKLEQAAAKKYEQASVNRADWNTAWRDPNYMANLDKVWGVTQPSRNARAYRASDLIGKDVKSRSGEDIGELEELVINMANQKVHYAVLEFDPSWASPEKNYAFPLRAFNLTGDKDDLVLDVDKAKIKAMKSFDDNRYTNLSDRAWVTEINRILIVPVAVTGQPPATASTASPSSTALFNRLDGNSDGVLVEAEAKANTGVLNAWSTLDEDRDGKVSRDDFQKGYRMEATK